VAAARLGRREVRTRDGVGLKGAAARTKTRDVRTARRERERPTEDRNERIESSRLGLWQSSAWSPWLINERLGLWQSSAWSPWLINERLGLWACPPSMYGHLLIKADRDLKPVSVDPPSPTDK